MVTPARALFSSRNFLPKAFVPASTAGRLQASTRTAVRMLACWDASAMGVSCLGGYRADGRA